MYNFKILCDKKNVIFENEGLENDITEYPDYSW